MAASVPPAIAMEIESLTRSSIIEFSFSSGGCINHGGRLITSSAVYFLKWNDVLKFPEMFQAEAKGLDLLRGKSPLLSAPEVIQVGIAGSYQFLLLEYIAEGSRGKNYWQNFGRGLASLHKHTTNMFGLDHDNYIGSLPQFNATSSSGGEFFAEQRIKVQLKMAVDAGKLDATATRKFDALLRKLPSLLPDERPSLLHGDLWGGNIMNTSEGKPCLIDPAVYYGYREADLAMTQLFGGFDVSFFDCYLEVYPLLPGYEERFGLYNLYPLLVHLNLFGPGYRAQVMSTLMRYV